jgi:hypothetical protein
VPHIQAPSRAFCIWMCVLWAFLCTKTPFLCFLWHIRKNTISRHIHSTRLACSIEPLLLYLYLHQSPAGYIYIYADALLRMHNKAQISPLSPPQDARNYEVVLFWSMWMLHCGSVPGTPAGGDLLASCCVSHPIRNFPDLLFFG